MTEETEKLSWLAKLKSGLSKSSNKISEGVTSIFVKRKLDDEALEKLEELLIESDMGLAAASEMTEALAKDRFNKDVTGEEVKEALAKQMAAILAPHAKPLVIDAALKPHVILMVGVNGNGKTTTIGKLGLRFKREGKKVMLAAADTFRAAAVEQLLVWGERAGIPVIRGEPNADPASVAYNALEQAKAAGADILMIDTAGRLQNKSNLMDELKKTIKVIKKLDASAPHTVLQVLDGTTGQNALSQVEVFKEMVEVNGLVVTKLDGTAKGGIVVALARKFGLPIHFIGIGEGIEDLQPFEARDFAMNLVKSA